ncbi:MAG: hypothetical protein QHH25_08190 [Candidatus Acetothermia bacterium]|nr:hypothetical protein [Candidatus Acetothermia bacterium]
MVTITVNPNEPKVRPLTPGSKLGPGLTWIVAGSPSTIANSARPMSPSGSRKLIVPLASTPARTTPGKAIEAISGGIT